MARQKNHASNKAIKKLIKKSKKHKGFKKLLEASLKQAKKQGKQLDKDLYKALQWPTKFKDYIQYLEDFAVWIPRQSDDPAWLKPDTDQHQEVYDRLCHFYWLVDQEIGEKKVIVEAIPWFSKWLVDYAKAWGSFLDTTDSFNDEVLQSFIDDSSKYRVEDSMINGKPNNPSGWLTFNQFFARELNPGLRPIDSPMDNKVVVAPADCTYRMKYAIDKNSNLKAVTVKKTHKYASIHDLLEGSDYKDDFAGGTFVHYFLGPYSYHRFHAPVSGEVKECYAVQGLVTLDVNLKDGQFDAPDNTEGGYEFSQARGIIIIDTKDSPYGDIGLVGILPIGMAQVSSVNMTATKGSMLLKGEEFGYFLFGGSDIILLFQKGKAPSINTCDHYRHYGTSISKCPPEAK
jgi:phosphatidylserine decarboxylase